MSEKVTEQEPQTLGEFLKASRETSNLSLDDAHNSTKIPLKILEAMEQNDFSDMPAEAFCRGFYVMYAKLLKLDSEVILSRYLDTRGLPPVTKMQATPPVRKSGQFSNYAEPSSITPFMSSIFTLFILLAVMFGGFWYFNWNPLDYLDSKLDAIQTEGQQEEIMSAFVTQPATPVIEAETLEPVTGAIVADETSIEEGKESGETGAEVLVEELTTPIPYYLEIYFRNNGTLTITLDKGFFIDKEFQNGQTLQWEAQESIVLDMPELIDATIRMNGIEIPLPDVENGRRLLSLPEDLLN